LFILIYNAVCIYRNKKDNSISLDAVMADVRFAIFGDDNGIGYLPHLAPYFAQTVLEHTIPVNVGMEYTNEAKSGESVDARSIFDITFLKRSFTMYKDTVRAPLSLDVIRETLLWQRKNVIERERLELIECTLCELAQHGDVVFKENAPLIVAASQKVYNYYPRNASFLLALDCQETLAVL